MKKRLLGVLLCIAMVVTMMAGCSSKTEDTTAPADNTSTDAAASADSASTDTTAADTTAQTTEDAAAGSISLSGQVAIIVPAADHGWLAGVSYYAEAKCKELGIDYQIYTSENVNDQASQIEEAISAKAAAIVLQPHTDEVSVAAQKIKDAGIPLVVFDRKVLSDYDAYIAGNNPGIGTSSADYIGEQLGGQGIVAVVNVPSSGSVSTDRVDAFKLEMSTKYPDIQLFDITADNFTQENGLKVASDALVAHDKIDAVFSIDDESSLGILQAIKDAGRTDVKYLSGAGGAQAYFNKIQSETGVTCFTATYSPSMIQDAIDAAVKIASGETVDKDIVIPPTIVTKDNVADVLDASSPY